MGELTVRGLQQMINAKKYYVNYNIIKYKKNAKK